MNVSKNSWHYKMAKFHQDTGCPPRNLCPYMRAVLTGLFITSFGVMGAFALIYGIGLTMFYLPIKVACNMMGMSVALVDGDMGGVVIGMFLWFVVAVAGLGALIGSKTNWLNRSNKKKEPSIVMEYIRAKRNKVCKGIDFV